MIITYILIVFLMIVPNAYAAISFTNGAWSSTFDYAECSQRGLLGGTDCADVQTDGIYWSYDDNLIDGLATQVTSSSNNPTGAGGNGFRSWKISGGDNIQTGTARIDFPAPQKELWIRWYERYEYGFKWLGVAPQVKSLYFRTAVATPGSVYIGYNYNTYRAYNQGGYNTTNDTGPLINNTVGWNTVYPDNIVNGWGTSDGSWHVFEVYLKMDTTSGGVSNANGGGKIWIDGVLIASKSNMNWSGGDATAVLGWTWFEFLSNQKNPALERPYYVDLDDMAIYNTTPPNLDAAGNPYIGLYSADTGPPSIAINKSSGTAIASKFAWTMTATDNVAVTSTQYCIATIGTECTPTATYTGAVTVYPGQHIIGKACDGAGNCTSLDFKYPWPRVCR